MTLTFTSWQRSAIFDLVPDDTRVEGRLTGRLPLNLHDDFTGESADGGVTFHFVGPRDVAALGQGTILKSAPIPLARGVETTKLVHIDLAEVDLPWRYSPAKAAGDTLRPWMVVLVGTGEELEMEGEWLRIRQTSVLADHDLSQSHLWAHVQEDGARPLARILSPRRLAPETEYVAALVTAFDDNGDPSWDLAAGRQPDSLRLLHGWRFWTGEAGDFETLATAIMPRLVPGIGTAPLAYRRGEVDVGLTVRGAITKLGQDPDGEEEATARADLAQFRTAVQALSASEPLGREIIGLPDHGSPWLADVDGPVWSAALNTDPRFRGIAGIGTRLGVSGQQALVDAAVAQLGGINLVAHLVSGLALGLEAAASLWRRRLPEDPAEQLLLFGPMLRRMRAQQASAMGALTGPSSPLEQAVFSTAARRRLGRATAMVRHSKDGIVRRSEFVAAANTCPPMLTDHLPGLPTANGAAKELGLPPIEDAAGIKPFTPGILEAMKHLVGRRIDFSDKLFDQDVKRLTEAIGDKYGSCERHVSYLADRPGVIAHWQLLVAAVRLCLSDQHWAPTRPEHGKLDVGDLRETLLGLLPEARPPDCTPIDLESTAGKVRDAVDPNGPETPARRRTQSRIDGYDLVHLGPPAIPVGIDFPVWTLLRDHAREWLVPGADRLPKDSVVAMQTNPVFIDSCMVGINAQLLQEMHWRNLPVTSNSTPLLMFWGHVNFETGEREAEIRPIGDWTQDSALGAKAHQVLHPGDTTGKNDLVILFRSELFRRYPSTLVYLVRPLPDADTALSAAPDFSFTAAGRGDRVFLGPIFKGVIEDDLVFFAFDVDPATLDQYWLVLDEPPAELRFRGVDRTGQPLAGTAPQAGPAPDANSADFAARTIDQPTRVGVDGAYLEQLGLKA